MCKYKYTFEGNKAEYRIEITNPRGVKFIHDCRDGKDIQTGWFDQSVYSNPLALEAAVLKKAPIGFRFRIPKEISADKFWSVVFVVLGVFIIFCR